jgi:hypothetical protein
MSVDDAARKPHVLANLEAAIRIKETTNNDRSIILFYIPAWEGRRENKSVVLSVGALLTRKCDRVPLDTSR